MFIIQNLFHTGALLQNLWREATAPSTGGNTAARSVSITVETEAATAKFIKVACKNRACSRNANFKNFCRQVGTRGITFKSATVRG
ncbi:uncharacterized protein LOC122501574 isoform X2 [Leptopilina heterotoma]|uniref:uncharacterized protein LOC122501574 isoform X2 n=1 Tax=Leptopilina heterotoma TaxID=63436 RepID=UPI001CA9D5CB|nr:uncharacterized protein LOC122501574 isoform X2 [Leptopilina heterotoma]